MCVYICICVCVYVYMCMYVYVCMCVCVCVYIYIYIYIYMHFSLPFSKLSEGSFTAIVSTFWRLETLRVQRQFEETYFLSCLFSICRKTRKKSIKKGKLPQAYKRFRIWWRYEPQNNRSFQISAAHFWTTEVTVAIAQHSILIYFREER